MLCKKRACVAIAALGAFCAVSGAEAHPAAGGLALPEAGTPVTKVDYYYDGPYHGGYHHGAGLLELPVRVLGGVAGLIGGVFTALDGDPCYDRPYYVSAYYGSPYYRDYSYSHDDGYYGRWSYYLDARYDSGGYRPYRRYDYDSDYRPYRRYGYDRGESYGRPYRRYEYDSPYGPGRRYSDTSYDRHEPYYGSNREQEIFAGYDYTYYYDVTYGRSIRR
jgi:hypothetical protein